MIAMPAIDLRDGRCVQLVGGSYDDERIRLDDPVAIARQWTAAGFARLHLVDLDAATGAGNNDAIVEAIVRASPAEVQVGGGIRSDERVKALLDAGASRVVVGTRAIEDREWLATIAGRYPGRVIVAADVRERRILTHGWARAQAIEVGQFVKGLAGLALSGLLVTAVHREGRLRGTDLPLMTELARLSAFPLIASGGVTTLDDLAALDDAGVAGAVIGMALYTGAIDPLAAASLYGR
jgi:phosphoribosylformimino-5-aminoimidazole carboxamide ribotide isomerase